MDLEVARSKQRAAQQQSQKQPDGIARIGDRDPETGRYTVQTPDGGILANGIKTYTAASNPGDIVVMFPRADGSIALDSEKGNPTIVPDIFNKPKPEVKKGGVWIFYRSAGKLWIGGHQIIPEEIGLSADPISSSAYKSGYHVWGDKTGWIATYQSTELFPSRQASPDGTPIVSLNFFTNENEVKSNEAITKILGNDSTVFYSDTFGRIPSHSVFPLGGGVVAFRSRIDVPITGVQSGGTGGTTSSAVYTGSASVSIGYMLAGVPSSESFQMAYTNTDKTRTDINDLTPDSFQAQSSFKGTTQIPYVGICLYKGIFDTTTIVAQPGAVLPSGSSRHTEYNIQSIMSYAIMCDRSATYYIRETVSVLKTDVISPATQRIYELFSSTSAQVLLTNPLEPRFFGIRWDLRTFEVRGDLRPLNNASLVSSFYDNPAYYYQFAASTGLGSRFAQPVFIGSLPVGYHRRSRIQPLNAPPLIPVYDYDDGTPVTYSGGSVVKIPATEIFKAKISDSYLVRKIVSIGGTESTTTLAYCFAIPADAEILHWSTTAA